MTQDAERFASAKLVREVAVRPDGDGCSVVPDHLAALNRKQRNRRAGEIKALYEDTYGDALVEKYALPDDMCLRVCLVPVSFRSFISFHLFCAGRWGGRGMRGECFRLCQSKASGNAFARSLKRDQRFVRADTAIDANANVMCAPVNSGISRRVGSVNMRSPRLQQIDTLLYPYSQIVPESKSGSRAKAKVAKLETGMRLVLDGFSIMTPSVRPSPFS